MMYVPIEENIRKHGRRVTWVGPIIGDAPFTGTPFLPFAYTIGNHERGLPELLVLGMGPDSSAGWLNMLSDLMAEQAAPSLTARPSALRATSPSASSAPAGGPGAATPSRQGNITARKTTTCCRWSCRTSRAAPTATQPARRRGAACPSCESCREEAAVRTEWKVSEGDQVAFEAEAKTIDAALKTLRQDRWEFCYRTRRPHGGLPFRPLSGPQLEDMRTRLAAVVDRLRYWRTVLMADEQRIRSPVRLWDKWHKLTITAEVELIAFADDARERYEPVSWTNGSLADMEH
jgi:hypothetical protein